MKNSIVLAAAAFLCLVTFPTTTLGKYWPKIEGWLNPSEISRNEMKFLNAANSFSYGDSKVWKCTYSNGSAPAISISYPKPPSPSTPSTPSPSTPSTPSPSTPSTPSPSTLSTPSPSTPSSPSPSTLSTPSPSTPSTTSPSTTSTPSPSTPSTPYPSPLTPKTSPPPQTPSPPPPTPKTSPPPSDNQSSSPSNPPPEHHRIHHHPNPWEHIDSCMRNMGPATMCRVQMEVSFYTRMFRVNNHCCKLLVNMKNECDDVVWGFFADPFFVPLVRYTCHVTF